MFILFTSRRSLHIIFLVMHLNFAPKTGPVYAEKLRTTRFGTDYEKGVFLHFEQGNDK
jgi:hypothetical protein